MCFGGSLHRYFNDFGVTFGFHVDVLSQTFSLQGGTLASADATPEFARCKDLPKGAGPCEVSRTTPKPPAQKTLVIYIYIYLYIYIYIYMFGHTHCKQHACSRHRGGSTQLHEELGAYRIHMKQEPLPRISPESGSVRALKRSSKLDFRI